MSHRFASSLLALVLLASSAGPAPSRAQTAPQSDVCGEIVESVAGALKNPDAFVYGLLLNLNPLARNSEYVHKLAVNDLKAATAGNLSPATARQRPVALVICNQGVVESDAATARAADQLINRFNVNAMVSLSNGQLIAAQKVIAASRRPVLHVCEQCQASARRSVQSIGGAWLVFQGQPARSSFSPVVYKTLPALEALARALPHFDGSDRIRVALIASDYAAYSALLEDVERELVINRSRASQRIGASYLRTIYASPQTVSGFDPDEPARRVAAFRPHIVLGVGSIELASVFDALERRIAATAPKPLYWGWTPTTALRAFIGDDDDRRARVYTIVANSAPLTPAQRERRAATMSNFSREFPGTGISELFGFYGVPYQLFYAAAAVSNTSRRITGADLLLGMAATQRRGATEIYVGRGDLNQGLAAAGRGPVALKNLNNAYPLDWTHHPRGEPSFDGARVYCYSRNPTTRALEVSFVGPSWDRAAGVLSGELTACR